METWGIVAHDEQTFMAKVVDLGIEEGILTRDRVDEIIRISVAMANKYVVQKEVDFRAPEELAKVQETILKLVGIGLEMRSRGSMTEGIRLLMEASPVELFRLAYTRIEKLRERWKLLLAEHRVEIMVSSEEFRCLSDLTCQRLADMSVFTESEIHTIRSLTMDDAMFTSLGVLEYYESELERYEFILRMKEILPFKLLNKSSRVRAEHLSEVDSIREALINTLVISAYVDGPDPVTVTMADIRAFLTKLTVTEAAEAFSDELEDVVINLIHELGEGLGEHEASLLTKEILETTRKLVESVVSEWATVNSSSEVTFFKRWSRLAILTDAPDPIERVLASDGAVDEFDFEMLTERLAGLKDRDVELLIEQLPWNRMSAAQIVTMFHRFPSHEETLARHVSLISFNAEELMELLEGLTPEAVASVTPALQELLSKARFTLEELELLVAPPHHELLNLLWKANTPSDVSARRILTEFKEGSRTRREVILSSCVGADFFRELFLEAWATDPALVKRQVRALPPREIGRFLLAAAGESKPRIVRSGNKDPELHFQHKELNALFKSLPATKKRAVTRFFSENQGLALLTD
jgi:hypothetical protein